MIFFGWTILLKYLIKLDVMEIMFNNIKWLAGFVFVGICFECHSMGQSVICNTHSLSNTGQWDTCSDRCFHHQRATNTACRMPLALCYEFDCSIHKSSVLWLHPDVIVPWMRVHVRIHNRLNIKQIKCSSL